MAQANVNKKKGFLDKWTNLVWGYQRRWFVLENGELSYFRARTSEAINVAHTQNACSSLCASRGTLNMANATIHAMDSTTFSIADNGKARFFLRAYSEVDQKQWITALEVGKCLAARLQQSSFLEDGSGLPITDEEIFSALKDLEHKLNDLESCSEILRRRGEPLIKLLNDLESNRFFRPRHGSDKIMDLQDKTTVFRIAANSMITAATEYKDLVEKQGQRWHKMLVYERNQKDQLEKSVKRLAKKVALLESRFCQLDVSSSNPASPNHPSLHPKLSNSPSRRFSGQSMGANSQGWDSDDSSLTSPDDGVNPKPTVNTNCPYILNEPVFSTSIKRRNIIPEKQTYGVNLWNIIKNCIGKELSKIPIPVNFSEPLSMLQRLTEDYEYAADCLDKAAQVSDEFEQLAYVAAFSVSAYATTSDRTGKPFNPLLGETFECDRMSDLGWRSIAEQVSHHPPTVAVYVSSKEWVSWQQFTMSSKFRGQYIEIIPHGIVHLVFKSSGNHYTWRKVHMYVNNIMMGTLSVDNYGDIEINNHITGSSCQLTYVQQGYFSKDPPRTVRGSIFDRAKTLQFEIKGTWDDHIALKKKNDEAKVFWKRRSPPDYMKTRYNFTLFAVQLNQLEEGVAPTDSRLRPDQREVEEGNWDLANNLKQQLEDKQRSQAQQREEFALAKASSGGAYTGYHPVWFTPTTDPITGDMLYMYEGQYWTCKTEKDWRRCPNIFL